MFLDAYYKMQVYEKLVRHLGGSSTGMSIPSMRLCNGTYVTNYFGGVANNTNYYLGQRFAFGSPVNSITSQTGTYSATGTGTSNIVVGGGTTAATKSDYKMESEITTGLSYVAVGTDYDAETGTITYKKTMSNSSGATITINEIGLTWPVLTGYIGQSAYQVLVYREVLETPLVVADGETFTVSITHQFTMPE